MFRLLLLILVPLVLYFVIQARAAGQEQPQESTERFTMYRTEDGFLRLDGRSGAVSLCRQRLERWLCEGVADADAARDEEIARLLRENGELRARLARLEQGERSGTRSPGVELPTRDDLNAALGFFEDVIRRFNEMVRRMELGPEPDRQKI